MVSDTPPDAVQPPTLAPPRPRMVSTKYLRFDLHNLLILFDSKSLAMFAESIRKDGILVPLRGH